MKKNDTGKILIYIIPVIIIIGIIYLMMWNKGDIDEKLPEQFKKEKTEIAKKDLKKQEIKLENKTEKKMENNLEVGKTYTTESGLKYEVLTLGTGETPQSPTDRVEVHYHGTLEDGTIFDSSVDRGEKISFGLNQVISGWTEGLQLMPVGSKFKFTIPANLAYGDASPSPAIPAGSTLIFEVELFGIN